MSSVERKVILIVIIRTVHCKIEFRDDSGLISSVLKVLNGINGGVTNLDILYVRTPLAIVKDCCIQYAHGCQID